MARSWTSTNGETTPRANRWLVVACLLSAAACRSTATPRTQPAGPALEVEAGPPAPSHGLPIVDLAVQWEPPRIVAGDLAALREALAETTTVEVLAPPRLVGPERQAPMSTLLQTLAPDAAATVLPADRAASFGPEPMQVELDVELDGDLDTERESRPPRYRIPERDWGSASAPNAEGATFRLAEAPLDTHAWSALPSHSVGSCQPVVDALALSQEQALAFLEVFLDHADEALQRQFRAALSVGLPAELERWRRFRTLPEAPTQAQRCGHENWQYLQRFAACVGGDACPVGPRMIVIGGARIGMPSATEPGSASSCAGPSAQVSRRRVETMASDATAIVAPQLGAEWTVLADRLGALTELYDALEDVCTPRRRRFAEGDVEGIRGRVARIGRLLGQDVAEEEGLWRSGSATVFVPGLGSVRELARFEASAGAAAVVARADALALRRFALSRALCRSGYGELPLVAAVLDATGVPRFFGFFYEEELFCAGLSPAVADAASEPSP